MKKENFVKYIINLSFFLYFLILILERSISISLSIINKFNLFKNGFTIYAYLTVFISITLFIVYTLLFNRKNFNFLFCFNDKIESISFYHMCASSGILLLSGMVHTEYTISWLKFISYGILIIGIILQTILNNKFSKNKVLLWLSLVYLISYSMAIPVSYECFLEYHLIFHIIQGISTYSLVLLFTLLMMKLFQKENNIFIFEFFILMLILDSILIALMWKQEINYFVLIFASLSSILFIIEKIVLLIQKRKVNKS